MTASRPGGRAAIVGPGVVGLRVAWFLQEEGFQVTVYNARGSALTEIGEASRAPGRCTRSCRPTPARCYCAPRR